jgi:membrane associated rhomboid family serine protease
MRLERWKRATSGFFGSGNNEPRPKLCPACGTLVGISAKRCHECGTSLTFSLAAMSKGLSEFFGGHAPVTTAILIVNLVMFVLSWVATAASGESSGMSFLWSMGNVALYRLGDSYPFAIWDGHEWFRLVTAMFLHGGVLHIGMNMMVLLDVGPVVEELYGSARYLFLYVVTGVAGFSLSAWHGHPAVGASGAIMGLIGVMIAVTTKRGGAAMQALRSRLISWVVSIFAIGFLMGGVIDNWGHFGGLAAGFALGKLFVDREPMNAKERKLAYFLGWVAAAVLVASFALMLLHYRDPLPWAG